MYRYGNGLQAKRLIGHCKKLAGAALGGWSQPMLRGANTSKAMAESTTTTNSNASELRLLMCDDKSFPEAISFTREILEAHPHIIVDALPQEKIADRIHEYDICVCRTVAVTSELISRATRLKVITQFGMGLERVDIEAATRRGIKVARIPSVDCGNALACAEHAIYLMLSLLRDQKGIAQSVLKGVLGAPIGETLFKKTVFIVGYGNIGKELAPRLKPFGVKILAVRPSWSKIFSQDGTKEENGSSNLIADEDGLVDQKGGIERLHEFNNQADIVVLCCPLTEKSRGMVNDSFLASMKRGALLVNIARGGLMDYNAVTAALNSGHLGGLGTDVTWLEPIDPRDPILQFHNVLVTPHIAGVTDFSYRSMAEIIADSALELFEGKPMTRLEFVN